MMKNISLYPAIQRRIPHRSYGHVELSALGASVVVTLVCKYDGRGDVVMFIAWTPPAMRKLMVAAD
jgi:hypothetical protein